MLLSCRCTSQITPEGNYQAINPDVRRKAVAYFTVKKEKKIQATCFHYLYKECLAVKGPNLSLTTDLTVFASKHGLKSQQSAVFTHVLTGRAE